MKAYRDRETGEFVDESVYNRSIAHGGTRYEEVDVEEKEPDRIFGSIDDFYYEPGDYEDVGYEDLFFDGGADYGEE